MLYEYPSQRQGGLQNLTLIPHPIPATPRAPLFCGQPGPKPSPTDQPVSRCRTMRKGAEPEDWAFSLATGWADS